MEQKIASSLFLVFAIILRGSAALFCSVLFRGSAPPLSHNLDWAVVGSPIHNVAGLKKCSLVKISELFVPETW